MKHPLVILILGFAFLLSAHILRAERLKLKANKESPAIVAEIKQLHQNSIADYKLKLEKQCYFVLDEDHKVFIPIEKATPEFLEAATATTEYVSCPKSKESIVKILTQASHLH